jgi:hypothetical protein
MNGNIFKENVARMYYDQLIVYPPTSGQNKAQEELRKSWTPITKQADRGRGPDIFFKCENELECRLELGADNTFAGSKILNTKTKKNLTAALTDPVYYTKVEPVAPKSLRDSLEQAFIVSYQGTKVVVMQDMKQYTETLPMVKTKTTNMQAFTYIIKTKGEESKKDTES